MSNNLLSQDLFLARLCKARVPVAIFLMNGIKLYGLIESFDPQVIMLQGTVTQMIYKQAIATVVPSRRLKISSDDTEAS